MIELPIRTIRPQPEEISDIAPLLRRQWLLTNGLGGYASGTLACLNSWHYHGLLVSAEAAPLGRWMSLQHVLEELQLPDGTRHALSGEERRAGLVAPPALAHLVEFRQEGGLPVWLYQFGAQHFERSIVMPYRQNSVLVTYRLLQDDAPLRLMVKPCIWFRNHEVTYDRADTQLAYHLAVADQHYEVHGAPEWPVLRLTVQGRQTAFTTAGSGRHDTYFRHDAERGIDARGLYWSPGQFMFEIMPGESATFIASTEPWAAIEALPPAESTQLERERRLQLLHSMPESLQQDSAAELALASDAFIIQPVGRMRDRIRALATGEQVRAVIAGYHWFTDWGRDTMISLEGLTLTTRRYADAKAILLGFNRYIRNGLIPNMFPDGAEDGLYHTADATLWYFHAIDRYLTVTGDRAILRPLLPGLKNIAEQYRHGTLFGIRVEEDGLLRQGEEGYQLTWMDAKVGDWVVTPRRGKTVELNGLWYNAVRLLADWLAETEDEAAAAPWRAQAEKTQTAFNARFWNPNGNTLYDVIDSQQDNDGACRPNQLLAFTLRHPVLQCDRWETVLGTVQDKLLTPVGLRTLAPDHPDYKAQYFGDLRARDAAYHQGTVWPWLIGPFVDAWLAVHPHDRKTARSFLTTLAQRLDSDGIGLLSEICDAESPYTARGCIAQAWSIAEFLRCWDKTAANAPLTPDTPPPDGKLAPGAAGSR